MFRISPDGSTLTVTKAHTTDSGKYTCVATNTAGEEDRIFNLNVYGGFHLVFFFHVSSSANSLTCPELGHEEFVVNFCFPFTFLVPPVIDGNSETVQQLSTVLDSSVNIECVATGSPPPQLNWLRNGLPLPVSSHIRLLSAGQVLR